MCSYHYLYLPHNGVDSSLPSRTLAWLCCWPRTFSFFLLLLLLLLLLNECVYEGRDEEELNCCAGVRGECRATIDSTSTSTGSICMPPVLKGEEEIPRDKKSLGGGGLVCILWRSICLDESKLCLKSIKCIEIRSRRTLTAVWYSCSQATLPPPLGRRRLRVQYVYCTNEDFETDGE